MSPSMKLSVLAFVGAAAAIPQYNVGGHGHGHASAHSKHHTPSAGHAGHAYPTGGWGGYNSTIPSSVAQGTGSPSKPAGEKTTATEYATESESTVTSTTTRTVYLTQYPSSAVPTVVNVKDVTSEAVCGPQTVYVTETNRVTVTVPAGGAPSSAPQAPSSSYEAAKPSVPAAKPSEPAAKPSEPAAKPSVPAAEPSVPAAAPPSSYEAAKPSVPAAKPSVPAEKPSSVAPKPSPEASPVVSKEAAPSSAAAVSTPAPAGGYAGGKRGLAYRWDGAADCKSFEGKNFGFVWNWEADTKGDVGTFAGSFIPTLRTLANAGEWASKAQAAIDGGSKVLFGLNEPDIASQANLDVASLCSAWKEHMNGFYGKATIVGPSVSSSQNDGQGLSYLQQFVQQCPEAKFDDINIHWYGPATAGFDAFKAHYQDAASKFPGKKIWVTEFGLTGATEDESADFLKSAQTYLDGESTCAGYSYFAVGNFDPAANLIGTMSALTKAGKVYVS